MLSFLAEWFDPLPQLTKRYLLKYFCDTNEAEMVELKTKRLFLKRSPCPTHFTTKDFALGSKVGWFLVPVYSFMACVHIYYMVLPMYCS